MAMAKEAKVAAIGCEGIRRAVRIGAAASALAVVLAGAAAGPALAVPGEARQVHVEGQIIPVAESPGAYKVTGGLVGTFRPRSERVIYAWTYFGTQIREIEGTASIKGCVDQNQNERCEAEEPSGELRLNLNRVASFDTWTGRLIEGDSTHQVISNGRFSGGVLTTREIPVHTTDEVVTTYQGDLKVMQPAADSKRAD
jgi:hypothetical protein